MSKPGGKPIVKKRPFHEDNNFAIGSNYDDDNRLVSFYFIDKRTLPVKTKEFKVNKNEIQRAWQELEKHVDPIAAALLKASGKSRRSKT